MSSSRHTSTIVWTLNSGSIALMSLKSASYELWTTKYSPLHRIFRKFTSGSVDFPKDKFMHILQIRESSWHLMFKSRLLCKYRDETQLGIFPLLKYSISHCWCSVLMWSKLFYCAIHLRTYIIYSGKHLFPKSARQRNQAVLGNFGYYKTAHGKL
jgi:hypothetical protein